MHKFLSWLMFLVVLQVSYATAQDTARTATKEEVDEVKGAVDGINETVLGMKSTLDALAKIKISGYIQAQYQTADTAGSTALDKTPSQVATYAGGAYPVNVRSRFQVRRGRFKINYDNDLTQYVLQLDVTQNGVGIKDAYVSVKEPWLRTVGLTAGIFDRPFGFEISYSSSNREAPERTRLFQTLFPGERELGAKIEVMAESGPLSYFNLKAGLFNGVLNTANENDRNKDFIGRLGFTLPLQEQSLAIDGGFSLYSGKVTNNSKYTYSFDDAAPVKSFKVDSAATNAFGSYGRSYVGGDMQLYYDLPVIGGFSLRGEYIAGQQPGTSTANSFYNPSDKNTPLYIRKFTGWYLVYVQNVGLKNQLVARYDEFDPNTDVQGSDIGAPGSNFTIGDVKYTTMGLGWIYHWDANVKFTVYYDIVMNEKVNSAATGALAPLVDDVKDNVLTLRMQYRF
jgi:hypothetical protein